MFYYYYNYEPTNANAVLLKSQCYSTPAVTCFGPHWPIVSKHTVVQNSGLKFSACHSAAENWSLRNIYVVV